MIITDIGDDVLGIIVEKCIQPQYPYDFFEIISSSYNLINMSLVSRAFNRVVPRYVFPCKGVTTAPKLCINRCLRFLTTRYVGLSLQTRCAMLFLVLSALLVNICISEYMMPPVWVIMFVIFCVILNTPI